jgi:acyl-CoA synthetase (AMP-forming)/AMP-acid ligase II
MKPPIPQVTLDQFETQYRDRHLLHAALDYWAARKPDELAVVNATRGTTLTWAALQRLSVAYAAELARMGLRKGDFLATSSPVLDSLIALEYACFRLGVIHAPLDLRLQPAELVRCLNLVHPKAGFFCLPPHAEAARAGCASLEHTLLWETDFPAFHRRAVEAPPSALPPGPSEHDGAQVIFTTGSTGSPKPALLSHRGIACQNLCLGSAFAFEPGQKILCNLPASHVGGQAELLLTTLFCGATAVTLEIFDAAKSLDAIERHGVTLVGQIPAMFHLEWRSADYARRNLASLRTAVYGGQAVPRPFLDQMLEMAPRIATGLGLTEASGFCTYTALTTDPAEIARGIGWSMPVYPVSIRQPMDAGGNAGAPLPAGEIGEICFSGPQNFLGYVGDPESTAATLSKDGWLYTGDLGSLDDAGLHFSGRAKWVLKPAGHQVFPSDVEAHFARLTDRVAGIGVVGQEHRLWSEGIVAFVEKLPGASITAAELRKHARGLTSYMRPLHYVVLEPGTMPLNRSAKVDVVRLQQLAREEVEKLRARGRGGA